MAEEEVANPARTVLELRADEVDDGARLRTVEDD
jgi:hypothetical protein